MAQGNATTTKRLFSRKTRVSIDVTASPETRWNLLTDAKGMTSWNSTLIELTGQIVPNGVIQLKSKLAPERTFKLKVKEFKPHSVLS